MEKQKLNYKVTIHILSMKDRNILNKFTKRQDKKLKIIPKYIDGNFMRLYYWVSEKKSFNRNPKKIRNAFWKELKGVCKKNKIPYYEIAYDELKWMN